MKEHKHSALYRYIEDVHGKRPWGAFLDAGAGINSIRWVAGLSTKRWTAVTGSTSEADLVRKAVEAMKRPQDQIIQGNWVNDQLLEGETYDTVLTDYLLGALEGFAPYFQPYLFSRLRPLTRKMLYVTGLEPYVPISRPVTKAGSLVWEIGRFRDACVLLKGGTPYREYPSPWVVDHVKAAGFNVLDVKNFNIGYKESFVNAQINISLHGLDTLADHNLAQALDERGKALQAEAIEVISTEGALRYCRNYVITAEPI